jgi:hypothetical protein
MERHTARTRNPLLNPQVVRPVRQLYDRDRHMLKRPRQGAGVKDVLRSGRVISRL